MRIILKLLAIPVLLLFMVLCLLGKAVTNISSYVIGLLFLVLAGCSIYCIVNAQWKNLAILAGMAVAAFAAIFLLVWFEFTTESISAKLGEFIRA